MKKLFTKLTAVFTAASMMITSAFTAAAQETPETYGASADAVDDLIPLPEKGLEIPDPIELTEEEFDAILEIQRTDGHDSDISVSEIEADTSSGDSTSTSYYYDQLNSTEKTFYDDLVSELDECYYSSSNYSSGAVDAVYYDKSKISQARAQRIFYAMYYSNPKFFFNCGTIYYGTKNGKGYIMPCITEGLENGSKRASYRSTVESVRSSWLSQVNSQSSVLGKENKIIELMVDNITYHLDSRGNAVSEGNNQTIAGAFVDKTCVCNGYAMAFTYLANAAGISAVSVCGSGHAWNCAQLTGKWYVVDVTWADPDSGNDSQNILKKWINKSWSTIRSSDTQNSHYLDTDLFTEKSTSGYFTVPSCTSDTVTDSDDTPVVTTYTVKFNSNGGTSVSDQTVTKGKCAKRPSDPTRSGYTFVDWYSDSSLSSVYDFSTPVSKNITLHAKWEKDSAVVTTYTVKFNSNGGTVVADETIVKGGCAWRPADPTRSGYTFVDWYTESTLKNVYYFNSPVTSDLMLYAKWSKNSENPDPVTYTVKFNTNGGTSISDQYVVKGGFAVRPSDPTKSGYTFVDWYSDLSLYYVYDFSKPVNGSLMLYAKWKKDGSTPDPSGTDDFEIDSNGILYDYYGAGGNVVIPSSVKRIADFAFLCNENIVSLVIPESVTRIGGNAFALTNIKSITVPQSVTYIGEEAFDCCDYLKDIYYAGSEASWNKLARYACVPSGCTVHFGSGDDPGYTEEDEYTVIFDSNGGSAVPSQTVSKGKKVTKPSDPVKDGYDFKGWYSNSDLTDLYNFSSGVYYDMTLYAGWKAKPAATLSLNGEPFYSFDDVFAKIGQSGAYTVEILGEHTEQSALKLPSGTAKITVTGGTLNLVTPTINVNCDLVLDCELDSSKSVTIKTAAGKTLTFAGFDSNYPPVLTASSGSALKLESDLTAESVSKFERIDTGNNILTVNGKLSGVSIFNGELAAGTQTDILTIGTASITVGSKYAAKTSVTAVAGELEITVDNGEAIASGTQIFTYKGVNFDGGKVVINNPCAENSEQLNAFLYKKAVKAEYAGAITLTDGNGDEIGTGSYPNLDKALEAVSDASVDYILTLEVDNVPFTKLVMPAKARSLTITGGDSVKKLELGKISGITAKCPLILDNVEITGNNKYVAVKCGKYDLTLTDTVTGAVTTTRRLSVSGNVTVYGAASAAELYGDSEGTILETTALTVSKNGVASDSETVILKVIDKNGRQVTFSNSSIIVKKYKDSKHTEKEYFVPQLLLDNGGTEKALRCKNGRLYINA